MDADTVTQVLNILQTLAKFFGVDPALLVGVAGATATNIVVVNLLKALFPKLVFNSRIPYVVAAMCILEAIASAYHSPFTLKSGAAIGILGIGLWVSTIGTWATAKIALHKVGTPATNPSGGMKPATAAPEEGDRLGGSSG